VNLVISYTSEDRDQLEPLLDGLHRLRHTVWHDQELSGGQVWWDARHQPEAGLRLRAHLSER
jgi:hypothetical protein